MKKEYQYKIINSTNGFQELEKSVSKMLNKGWKPIGGLAFNQGHAYQAMAKLVEIEDEQKAEEKEEQKTPRPRTYNEAMKALDELT